MSDLRLISPPPRAELLAQVRNRLGHAVPGARVIATGMLGADAPIDFVAVEPGGRVVLVLVGDHDQDLELVGRGLAQRAWVAARLGDWAQLAPNLGLRAGSPVRVLLLCPGYGSESRAAIAALGREVMAPGLYHCIRNGAGFEVLVEHLDVDNEADASSPTAPAGPADPSASPFRTGMTDADLDLTADERLEFE